MTISKQSAQAYIAACMAQREACDRRSEKAYANGDHRMGSFWGGPLDHSSPR
jgi:hypothetical protein